MRLLIVSAPRSGTGYASALFTAIGFPTGHELVYTYQEPVEWKLPGESSWLAAPFLSDQPEDVVIFHQRRDPLLSAVSNVVRGFFTVEAEQPWREFAEKWVTTIDSVSELERAMDFHQKWHQLIDGQLVDRTHVNYRVEDLDADLLIRLCHFFDFEPDRNTVIEALAAIPRNTNTDRPFGGKE